MNKLPFMGFVIGTLLLASGGLTGIGVFSTLIPMYIGIGVICISLVGAVYRIKQEDKWLK